MAVGDPGSLSIHESWDSYWRRASHNAAYASGGDNHPAIQTFWDDVFETARSTYGLPKIIDIASGSGAVVERAASTFGGKLPDFTCLDISAPAIARLEERFPSVHTIVADACDIPLGSAAYDIVTSQFGIEYASRESVNEVARLVAPGGQLVFLLHNQASSIYRECVASSDVVEGIQQAKFIPYAITMFEKGFAACRGADRAEYDAAAKQFSPAILALESIMTQHGKDVAGGLVSRLYDDVGTIHESIQRYEPVEVLNWLNGMQGELQAFAERMASMRSAALDSTGFDLLCEKLRQQDFTIVRSQALADPGQPLPLAWEMIANRE